MKISEIDNKIITNLKKILKSYDLCDNCIGRIIRKKDPNFSNNIKGKQIREKLNIDKTKVEDCFLCEGLISEINKFIDLLYKELKNYEFKTFLIGAKIDDDILKKEEEIYKKADSEDTESIKSEINRKIGLDLEEKLEKEVSFQNPTIMAIIDTQFDVISLQIKSLFIYGRYNKYARNIPQTKWYCRICRGKGCRKCNYSGTLYDTSVEELISRFFLVETKSDDESFHGAGREDIDVKMLGKGRPFVLELKNPKIRNINLEKIETKINKEYADLIKISDLGFSDRKKIAKIKQSKYNKCYRVVFECNNPVNIEKLKKVVKTLQGKTIKQKTPSRVAHRRADLVRNKTIYNCKIESVDEDIITLKVETESGTYIKELINGDDNRTQPSISSLLNNPCKVKQLDVIEVKGE